MMKLFAFLILSLMVEFLTPVWATSGKDSGGISQQNWDAIKLEIANSSSAETKQTIQVKSEAPQDQTKSDSSAKQ